MRNFFVPIISQAKKVEQKWINPSTCPSITVGPSINFACLTYSQQERAPESHLFSVYLLYVLYAIIKGYLLIEYIYSLFVCLCTHGFNACLFANPLEFTSN